MSEYTRDSKNIYFLNDKNIISSFEDTTVVKNPIVSQSVLKTEIVKIDEKIKDISGDIEEIPTLIDSKIDENNKTLSTDVLSSENRLVCAVKEEKGKISVYSRQLVDSDFEELLPESRISNLTRDLNNISSNYASKIEFDSTLSTSFGHGCSLSYIKETHMVELDVHGQRLSFDAYDFVKGRIVKKVWIEEDSSGKKYLCIMFADDETDIIKIQIDDLFPMYKQGMGIKIDTDLKISVDNDVVPFKTQMNVGDKIGEKAQILRSLTQTDGKIDYTVEELSTSHITDINSYVDDKINTKIASLTAKIEDEDRGTKTVKGGFLCALYENDGIITGGFRHVVSSDFGYVEGSFLNKLPCDIIENFDVEVYNRISVTISSITSSLCCELSDLRQDMNDICSSISATVDDRLYQLSDTLSTYTNKQISDLCSSLSTTIHENYFKLGEENTILCSNVYNEYQKFDELSARKITVDFQKLFDLSTQLVDVGDTFDKLYVAMNDIKKECGLTTAFDYTFTICQTINAINGYAEEFGMEVEPLSEESTVEECFNRVIKIVEDNNIVIHTNLREELENLRDYSNELCTSLSVTADSTFVRKSDINTYIRQYIKDNFIQVSFVGKDGYSSFNFLSSKQILFD